MNVGVGEAEIGTQTEAGYKEGAAAMLLSVQCTPSSSGIWGLTVPEGS